MEIIVGISPYLAAINAIAAFRAPNPQSKGIKPTSTAALKMLSNTPEDILHPTLSILVSTAIIYWLYFSHTSLCISHIPGSMYKLSPLLCTEALFCETLLNIFSRSLE